MTFRSMLLAASILALPGALANAAEPLSGLYVGAGIGVNIMQDEQIDILSVNGNGRVRTNAGFGGVVSTGYGFGNGLRAEIEGDYRYNSFSRTDGGTAGVGGKEQKYGGFLNVLYDFNTLSTWVVPYVGVGVGYQAAQWTNFRLYTNNFRAPNAALNAGDATQGSFAYQGIVGDSFPVSPQLSITGEYHFMGLAQDRRYSATQVVTIGQATFASTFRVKATDDYNHTILVGLRYAFNAPPAPVMAVAAAPAPAPSRSYLVFFDWDKSNLTDRARQIIRDAADNSRKVQYTKLEVNGYTDTSGTPKYNQGLSVRRAQAVAAELVKDGVPRNAISITGFGDTKLLVPTGPGVREPQNRRVEIIIR